MILNPQLRAAALAALTLTTLLPCLARGAGDADDKNFLRFGYEHVYFHDDNPGYQGPGIPPNAGLQTDTENLNAVYLSYARALSDHWELAAVLGIPPIFHVHARGPAYVDVVPFNGQPISSGRQMAPSLLLNYKFNEPGAFYRPYLGIGVIYSHYYDIHVTDQGNQINGGPTSATYSDTVGLRITAGVALKIADHWYGTLSISKADISPDVTLHTLGVNRTNSYSLNPTAFTGALSFGF